MLDLIQKKKDFTFGFSQETRIIDIINLKLPRSYKTLDECNHFDFRNDEHKIDIELKSRRIWKGQYPTVFFGKCKLLAGRERLKNNTSLRIIYLFNFQNKKDKNIRDLWFWEDNLETVIIGQCGNYKRNDKEDLVVEIPMDKLKQWELL